MQVVPVPLNVTTVRSQNDLKPTISTFRSFSKMSPLVPCHSCSWLCCNGSKSLHQPSPRRTAVSPCPCCRFAQRAMHPPHTRAGRNQSSYLQGRSYRRRKSDRCAVARQNVWQVLDQSPAAWRVNGGTGKHSNTNLRRCKAPRNPLWFLIQQPQWTIPNRAAWRRRGLTPRWWRACAGTAPAPGTTNADPR